MINVIEKESAKIFEMIKNGENAYVEFKEVSGSKLPSSLFETICAMLNRHCGHIFLGINDDGEIVGVRKEYINTLKKNIVSLCNNHEKIFPTIHLDVKEFNYEDKIVLYFYVYESSDVHITNGKIFDRNEDGDFNVTGNTAMISQMYIRKTNTYIENQVFPFVTFDDLRSDLIERARIMAVNRQSDHPWKNMTDMEILKSASLYMKDSNSGKEGITLAGILLFGKDTTIHEALGYYKTDALLRVKDIERYDDRDDIRTNLIESYDRLLAFVRKHTDDRFYLEGSQRIDVRMKIAREVCANLLMHREFSNPFPARLIITKDNLFTQNANKSRNVGYIDLSNYTPYPKNPKIAAVFKEIGLADELGSGMQKIYKYTKIYSNSNPIIKEGDVYEVTIPLNEPDIKDETGEKKANEKGLKTIILDFIKEHNGVSRKEINEYVYPMLNGDEKYKKEKVRNVIDYLKNIENIKNTGTRKNSNWILSAKEKRIAFEKNVKK